MQYFGQTLQTKNVPSKCFFLFVNPRKLFKTFSKYVPRLPHEASDNDTDISRSFVIIHFINFGNFEDQAGLNT